jgi:hypothetical protein
MQAPCPAESYKPTDRLKVPAARMPEEGSRPSAETTPRMWTASLQSLALLFLGPVIMDTSGSPPGRNKSKTEIRLSEPVVK